MHFNSLTDLFNSLLSSFLLLLVSVSIGIHPIQYFPWLEQPLVRARPSVLLCRKSTLHPPSATFYFHGTWGDPKKQGGASFNAGGEERNNNSCLGTPRFSLRPSATATVNLNCYVFFPQTQPLSVDDTHLGCIARMPRIARPLLPWGAQEHRAWWIIFQLLSILSAFCPVQRRALTRPFIYMHLILSRVDCWL